MIRRVITERYTEVSTRTDGSLTHIRPPINVSYLINIF